MINFAVTPSSTSFTTTPHLANFIAQTLEPALTARMAATGLAMTTIAQAACPVDTGDLRRSIAFRYDPDTRRLTIYANTHYALFVEYGTRRMRAQPYLRPSLRGLRAVWRG